MTKAVVALVLAAAALPAAAAEPPTYQNPLPLDAADPFVYRLDRTYFLYGTSANDGLLYWTSSDLVHWQPQGYAFRRDATTWAQDRFWAPELFEHGGKFYLHFSAAHGPDDPAKTFKHRVVLAEADSPRGPFWEIKAPWFETDKVTIDSHVFRDRDGKLYLYSVYLDQPPDKHFEIHVRTLDGQLEPSKESKEVLRPTQTWEKAGSGPQDAFVTEAPFVVRRGDTYFLTWSANPFFSKDYGVGVATGNSPTGPFTKRPDNPILRGRGLIVSPGHHCFVDSPDGKEWFIVYHVNGDPATGSGRRRIAVDRVKFAEGEGAAIEVLGPTDTPQSVPVAQGTR